MRAYGHEALSLKSSNIKNDTVLVLVILAIGVGLDLATTDIFDLTGSQVLCAEFGMTVIAVDPRVDKPPPGVSELHRPEALNDLLPRGDFVIVTVPETPRTQGLFGINQFQRMKSSAFFINIGRGATVILDEPVEALQQGQLAGAGLDVFQTEPLPTGHPLWETPGVLITPHVAGRGPYLEDRRTNLFIDNCIRFNEGRPLVNVVEKEQWF